MSGFLSLGDLSSTLLLRQQTTQLKRELQRGVVEVTTGRTSTLSTHLKGDFRALAAFDRSIRLGESRRPALAEAQILAEAMQSKLAILQSETETAALSLVADSNVGSAQTLTAHGTTARRGLEAAIDALNQQVAGRSMFAGAAIDRSPLASASEIMTQLETLTAGETTAAGVIALVDDWFDTPGGGFETVGYLGSTERPVPVRLSDGTTADLGALASDPEIRDALRSLALGALLSGPTLAGDLTARQVLAQEAGLRGIAAASQVTESRARVGSVEEKIGTVQSRNEAEIAARKLALVDLVGIDPHDAATRLQATQSQLETLFALTARVQSLTLADYLR
jgi:flagellar hook-associated protein 3 FlgL